MEDATKNITAETGEETSSEHGKLLTQEEVNALIGNAKKKERAKFADYKELKAKAEKFDEIEEASKSELQKAQDELSELKAQIAERQAADERAELVNRIANEYKVPAEYRCLLKADTEEELIEHAQLLSEKFAEPSLNEGSKPCDTKADKTPAELFAEWSEKFI